MNATSLRFLLVVITASAATTASIPPRAHQLDEAYTFSEYLAHFNKIYSNPEEYAHRSHIFNTNLKKILAHNEGRMDESGKVMKGYVMGVNRFTDQEMHEVPMGYNKAHRAYRGGTGVGGVATATERRLGGTASYSQPPDFEMEEVSDLPESVDWRSNLVSPVPKQGSCGDCWAFAATACVEAHLAIGEGSEGSAVEKLSVMNKFECSPNPQQCGGTGKCEGSIPELGWNYIADLTVKNRGGIWAHGWTLLPSNDYKTTMNAVHKVGPLAIAVAAGDWMFYESGVFSGDHTTVNHAVVLAGYGVDETTGEKYYLIRNSWGNLFGENGYIRIKRTDDDDNVCVVDTEPLDGIACALDENGNKLEVEQPKVCANSAVLFDVSYPVGVHRL